MCTCWVSCQTERKYFLGINNIRLWKQRVAFVNFLTKVDQIAGCKVFMTGCRRWFMNIEYFPIYHLGHKEEKPGERKGLIALSFHCICTKRRSPPYPLAAKASFVPRTVQPIPPIRTSNTEKVGEIRAIYVNFSLFMYSGIL